MVLFMLHFTTPSFTIFRLIIREIISKMYSWHLALIRECVRAGAAGSRTRRSLGHHLLHPLILRLVVLYAPAVLRPRALPDASAPADPNS